MDLLAGSGVMSDTPQVLLAHHLKALKLPTFLREYDKVARQCAAEGVDHPRYLLRLAELELIERERRMVERRIKAAKFPTVKSLDSFDFAAFPSLEQGAGAGAGALASTSSAARTSSRSATAAPARPTSHWGSAWPPARRACRSASPPPPPWSTS